MKLYRLSQSVEKPEFDVNFNEDLSSEEKSSYAWDSQIEYHNDSVKRSVAFCKEIEKYIDNAYTQLNTKVRNVVEEIVKNEQRYFAHGMGLNISDHLRNWIDEN